MVNESSVSNDGSRIEPIDILNDDLHERMYGKHSFVLNSIFRNSKEAISSLGTNELLNDTVITYVMKSLTMSCPSETKFTIDTFLQKQIDHDGLDEKRSEARLKKMFSKMIKNLPSQKIFVPINAHGDHWSLMVIDIDNHQFSHYCSLHSRLEDYRKTKSMIALMGKVINSLLTNHQKGTWTCLNHSNTPTQDDGVSCGLFLCIFAKCLYFEEKIKCSKTMLQAVRQELKQKFVQGQKAGFLNFKEPCWKEMDDTENLRRQLLLNAECEMCFKTNGKSVIFEGPKGIFLKFCDKCKGQLNRTTDEFGKKFAQDSSKTCFGCGKKQMPMNSFHSVKTLIHFCRACVIRKNCICNTCKYPVIDVQTMNTFLRTWDLARVAFMTNKGNNKSGDFHIKNFLDRRESTQEALIEHEFEIVDHVKHKGRFAFFNQNVTYADMYELRFGLGNEEVYVKQTVMKMFFQLVQRRHQPKIKFEVIVNAGKLIAEFELIGSKSPYGIFDLERFVYIAIVDGMWISVCVMRVEFLHYEIISWLPSEEWKDKSQRLTNLVGRTLQMTWDEIKRTKEDATGTLKYDISFYTSEDSKNETKSDKKDSGIYAMYYSYLFILDKRRDIFPNDILKYRRLAFLSIVSMDCQYGFIRLPKEKR